MTVFWRTNSRWRRRGPSRTDAAMTGDGGAAVAVLTTLGDLAPGERARIMAVLGEGPLAQRMMQLGLLAGAEVELVRRAPAGDPIELRLMGYSLSLRATEARTVTVERLG